ncbi:alpha-amylase [Stachybotrys elegans]|uniref:Alpha-amylase n=1 Tax=Stachybotrys elegans TaxID=80388 RepID=A0A8K0SGJ5_9HYPO|nr:alpha-amylase [Stachybotrys elegans]
MHFSKSLLTGLVQLAAAALAADTESWKSRNIYFALTDRIARGADDNGGGACGNLGNYCGGTWRGLESKLDYIRGMGFDAIWITPVVANHANGYHGYHAQDLYEVNGNHGTREDLKSLVNAAHQRGMYIMVDVVANHMGPGPISSNRPEPLNQGSAYHSDCTIDYNNQGSIENCRIAGLPDINTQDPAIRTLLQDWIRWLVNEYQFDGIRIDTVKHVERDFWPDFAWASGVYSIGEVWDGNPDYLAQYRNTMAGFLNYPIYYPLGRFFRREATPHELVNIHNRMSELFPDPTTMGTFIDNHDNRRWLNNNGDRSLLKNALAYVILARGIPIVYYGTEQGYAGGDDPQNREDLWRSGFNTQSDLYQAIARLSAVRAGAGGLGANDHVHLHVANDAYAFGRAGGDVIVLTNNRGSGSNGQYCFNTQRPNGRWENSFGGGQYSSDGSGNVCVNITNGEPVVLVAN